MQSPAPSFVSTDPPISLTSRMSSGWMRWSWLLSWMSWSGWRVSKSRSVWWLRGSGAGARVPHAEREVEHPKSQLVRTRHLADTQPQHSQQAFRIGSLTQVYRQAVNNKMNQQVLLGERQKLGRRFHVSVSELHDNADERLLLAVLFVFARFLMLNYKWTLFFWCVFLLKEGHGSWELLLIRHHVSRMLCALLNILHQINFCIKVIHLNQSKPVIFW